MKRLAFVASLAAAAMLAFNVSSAFAVTPGWECVPTTAGQAVVSGGTGAAPTCGAGTTAVLAPTYVSSGVGGKPTVEFSTVNVQVVSGSGSTHGAVNGEGNLVVGYAENSDGFPQTGSNDLIVGSNNGWSGFGQIVGGFDNTAVGNYAAAFGLTNVASGAESLVAGSVNVASGLHSSATGGSHNTVSAANAAIGGGLQNIAGSSQSFIGGGCDNLTGLGKVPKTACPSGGGQAMLGGQNNHAQGDWATAAGGHFDVSADAFASTFGGCKAMAGTGKIVGFALCLTGAEAVLGGYQNTATGLEATVTGGEVNFAPGGAATVAGGQFNSASGGGASVLGGNSNIASGDFDSILGGFENQTSGRWSSVSGGESNTTSADGASVLGGDGNTASSNCQAIPAAPGSC